MIASIHYNTSGTGLFEFTERVAELVSNSGIGEGLCTLFIQHTSASLCIQENADPSAKRDLERWLERLVPPNDPLFTHTAEGPDDMPSHIKSALTSTSLSIPIFGGRLALGTWQGIFVWEHRTLPHKRKIVVHLLDDHPSR
jgi:secondary thiamine-phosphate synthase enzyme